MTRFLAQPNAAPLRDRRHAFALDPGSTLRALRSAEARGEVLRAIVHAHCEGPLVPSAADREGLWLAGRPAFPGVAYWIVNTREGRAFRYRRYHVGVAGTLRVLDEGPLRPPGLAAPTGSGHRPATASPPPAGRG